MINDKLAVGNFYALKGFTVRRDDIFPIAKARMLAKTITETTLPIWAGGIIDAYEQLQKDGYTKEQARKIAADHLSEYIFSKAK